MSPDYIALAKHLATAGNRPVRMKFVDIEKITGRLPASARRRWRTWWANAKLNPQAVAWMAAGRKVIEVNILEDWVLFSAPSEGRLPVERRVTGRTSPARALRDALFDAGTSSGAPDWSSFEPRMANLALAS